MSDIWDPDRITISIEEWRRLKSAQAENERLKVWLASERGLRRRIEAALRGVAGICLLSAPDLKEDR